MGLSFPLNPQQETPLYARRTPMVTCDRRRFLGATAMALAAAQLGGLRSEAAQSPQLSQPRPTSTQRNTLASLGPVKQIDAGVLNVGYVEAGPSDGAAVIL